MKKSLFFMILILMTNLALASSVTGSAIIIDADYITIYPGEEEQINLDIENNFDYSIEEISASLILENIPFNAIGSSEKEVDEIDDEDSENIQFKIKASTDIEPGDYNIPYKIRYKDDSGNITIKEGSFGIRVSAKTNLDFSVETENAIINKQGKLSLKVINKGLGEIKFISVKIFPQGYELLSSDQIYIGTIDSDEDDTATYDVIFKEKNAKLIAKIEYKDFENLEKSQSINLPIKVYTQEEAINLGLIQQNRINLYLGIVAGIILLWIIWGRIKKRRKNKNRNK